MGAGSSWDRARATRGLPEGDQAHVTAIDSFADAIKRARASLPDASIGRVDIHHVALDDFVAASEPSTFDIAILSWSLC